MLWSHQYKIRTKSVDLYKIQTKSLGFGKDNKTECSSKFRIAHHVRMAVNCVMKTSKRTQARRVRPTSSIGLIGKSLPLCSPRRQSRCPSSSSSSSSLVWLIDYRVSRRPRPFMQSRYYALAAVAAAASHCPIHPILYSVERTMDQSKKEEGKRRRAADIRSFGG